MIKKLFEVKFLHLLPESSGQIGTAIFPKSPVEPEVCPLKPSKIISKQLLIIKNLSVFIVSRHAGTVHQLLVLLVVTRAD